MSSIASPRGGLRVVAATVAVTALGLHTLRLGADQQVWITKETLAALSGPGIVLLTISLAAGVWGLTWGIASLRLPRPIQAFLFTAAVIGALALYVQWERSYWENRLWRSADLISLPSNSMDGTRWRGRTGGDCGIFGVFEVTFDSDSTATGRVLSLHSGDPLFTLAIAAGSTREIGSRPIRAVLRHGLLYVLYPGDDYAYGPIVLNDPIPE